VSPALAGQLELTRQIVIEPAKYRTMLLDWAMNGAASEYVLSPDEVVRRSAPRSDESARAAAHFELGQHLFRTGEPDAAVDHWREAHRLQPENWTYKRQAWRLDPLAKEGGRSYDSNWTADVKAIGPENYYPRLQA
jgi:tetratricopeptide (TPR) repeat protein